jgi:uncharacterized protein YuzE
MSLVRITYDPDGDILYITFGQPIAATGYQLSDQILLRVHPQTQTAAGLTIFNYSLHVSTARKMPLTGLAEDPEVTPVLLRILTMSPVSHFLRLTKGKQGVSVTLRSLSLQDAVAA